MANGANFHDVDLIDGRQVRFSYGVPVAAFIPRGFTLPRCEACGEKTRAGAVDAVDVWIAEHGMPCGYLKTTTFYSSTTSKHANAFANPVMTEVPDEVLRRLIEPLTGAR